MIELQNVTKIYDGNVIGVQDANIKIDQGEFVFLVGESGSGKSTLLRLLIKEINPTSGKIFIDGQNVTRLRSRKTAKLRRRMGFVFQDYRLLPKKTVYENVAFAMEAIEETQRRIRRRVPRVLNMVGLAHKSHNFPNEISGGEQQRTAIARAVANNPVYLLADEPTGNLDPRNAKEIMDLMEHINSLGTTVIIATHDKETVDRMQKRVIHIMDGKVVKDAKGGYDI